MQRVSGYVGLPDGGAKDNRSVLVEWGKVVRSLLSGDFICFILSCLGSGR